MTLEDTYKLYEKRVTLKGITIRDLNKQGKFVDRTTDAGGVLKYVGPRKNVVCNDPLTARIGDYVFVLENLDQIELQPERINIGNGTSNS